MTHVDGFDEFVRSRGDDLRQLAFLLTSDQRAAERAVQDALVKCLAGWAEIDKHSDPYVRARELLLAQRVRRGPGDRGPAGADDGALADPARDQSGIGNPALSDSARLELRDGLAILRGKERAVVVLRVFEGLSPEESADALDTTERAVAKLTTSALARVRSEAAGPGSGPGDRVTQVHRLLRSRRRRGLLTAVVTVSVVGLAAAAVVTTGNRGRAPSAAASATASSTAATSSASNGTLAQWRLASVSSLPAPRRGGLVLQPGGPGHTQLWVYAADDFRPIRALGQLYDRGVHLGPATLDPSDPDRVVFVRVWNLGAVCAAPPCATPAGSDDGQLIWRLYSVRPSTGKETALTAAAIGQGPDRVVISPDGWRVALVTGAGVDIINALTNQSAPTHVTLKSEFVQVLGFLANGGPLVVWETSTFYPGVVWASRQWVSTVDLIDSSQQHILYDSDVANCNPTSDLWLLPTDQLVLQTRCGPRPGPMSNGRPTLPEQGMARIYVADAEGVHLLARTNWGPAFRHDLQLDSTGTSLLDELEPKSGPGHRVVDRITLTGQRTRIVVKATRRW